MATSLWVAPAAVGAKEAESGTSSRAARSEAASAIPWQQLTPADRQTVHSVAHHAGIYRRLPTRVIDCDPEMFDFLLAHPEVIVDVWKVMGISRVRLERLPSGAYRGTDGAGADGTVRFLSADRGPRGKNTALVMAEGTYQGKPFVVPVAARTILLLRTDAVQERNGRHYITVRVDAFIDIQQTAIEIIAKTVQPWVNSIADRNYMQTLTFVSTFSRTAEKNPQGMRRLAARLTTVDEATRNELVELCYRAAKRHARNDRPKRTDVLVAQHDGPMIAPSE